MTLMTDEVQTFLSNARGAEYGFVGAAFYALSQFEKKNNKPLYALIAFTNGKKFGAYKIEEGYSISQFSVPLKRMIAATIVNTSFIYKDGKAAVRATKKGEPMGVNTATLENLRELLDLHNGSLGIKSAPFQAMFPVAKKAEPTAKTGEETVEAAPKAVDAVEKKAKDGGHNELAYLMAVQAELTKRIAALQAEASPVALAA